MKRQPENHGHGAFTTLDGMRGFGAIIIIIAHSLIFWDWIFTPASAVAVDLFFLLSGFVIAYAYEPKFARGLCMREFMLHRFIRLYPLYLFGAVTGFTVLMAAALGDAGDGGKLALIHLQQAPLQFLMIPTEGHEAGRDLYSFNSPAWTLFFELWVNLIYVFIWPWLTRRVLVGLVVICAAFLAIAIFSNGSLFMGAWWETFWGGFARASFGFFAGVLIYRFAGAPSRPSSRRSVWSLACILAVLAMTVWPSSEEMRPYIDVLMVLVLAPALIFLAASIEPPRFIRPVLASLGRVSFALYILHYPIHEAAMRAGWSFPWLFEAAPWSGAVLLALTLAICYGVEKYYDQPVRRMLMKRASLSIRRAPLSPA